MRFILHNNIHPIAKSAVVLHGGTLGDAEKSIFKILDFYGISYVSYSISKLCSSDVKSTLEIQPFAIFASLDSVKQISTHEDNLEKLLVLTEAAFFFASNDLIASSEGMSVLLKSEGCHLVHPPQQATEIKISSDLPELTGAMTGIKIMAKLGKEDFICRIDDIEKSFVSVLTVGCDPVFLAGRIKNTYCCISSSSKVVNIDAPVEGAYYDVKSHFCSAVPIVMFIKYVFSNIIWQPVEHGACLIIDDPVLKLRYGHCDFKKLIRLMNTYGFSTDISFIPWNWWRTSREKANFFIRENENLSVSIHGCDHMAAEFGAADISVLTRKARLAKSRMQRHQKRCGFRHDDIMIFPQGVFSSECPKVLSRQII